MNAENEEQWRRRISSGEDDSGASRRPLRIQLPEDTRIPPDWSLDWQPAIPLPWTYSLSLVEEAIEQHIAIQTGRRQAQSARAKDMHARRAAAAAGDTIQSGEGSDNESESSNSDRGSNYRGYIIITNVVRYLLGDN